MSREDILARNIVHFVQLLRQAGLPIGQDRTLAAVTAAVTVGMMRRDDLYWALYATLISRPEHQEVFDQAFNVFWRLPQITEKTISPALPTPQASPPKLLNRYVINAMQGNNILSKAPKENVTRLDATLNFSEKEKLYQKDFEIMSPEEFTAAKISISQLDLLFDERPTRRFQPNPYGRKVDFKTTLRLALRSGRDLIPLRYSKPQLRPPPVVILCDISGSMDRYSRLLLHFLHALKNDRDRISIFLFGTRLSHITRLLRHRDVDVALQQVSQAVSDWSGGTRIGACLSEFNRIWASRMLSQGAIVLFISDGIDRDAGHGLAVEMERLHKSCHRLIWLNPLLRYSGYAPTSSGNRAIIPHVDELRPIHNLTSLKELAMALKEPISYKKAMPYSISKNYRRPFVGTS